MPRIYKALTWDHPRGHNALAAAAETFNALNGDCRIEWDKQPLEGFESHPIEDLCNRYDVVVLDHPHLGEALASDCLQPLESIFDRAFLDELEANTVGPCLSSYRMNGQHWALPLDAATQVMARRADLVPGAAPSTWEEVRRLSRESGRVALSLAGPHAILSFQSIATAFGEPPATADPETFIGEETARAVLELMSDLARGSPASVADANPIQILEHMSVHDDVALCPLVYGYVNYSAAERHNRISFSDAPRCSSAGRPGSTLGGTGIAITKRCDVSGPLREHLAWLLSVEAQTEFIPGHDGQPSNRLAWNDDRVNRVWGGFYRDTIDTVEGAFVRPRHDGAISFQSAASAWLRQSLGAGTSHDNVARRLNELYVQSRKVFEEVEATDHD